MKKVIFLSLIAIFISMSCSSTKRNQTKDKDKTQKEKTHYTLSKGTKWVMISFNGKEPKEAGFIEKIPYVVIDKEAGSIGGNSGCNAFNGPVKIDGPSVKVGLLAATKAYCMNVPEQEFFNFLNDINSYKIEKDTLQLLKDGKVLMEFKADKKQNQ